MKFLFVVCVLSMHTTLCIHAQKLHIVVFCDTNDKSIGVNKESERKITVNEMQTITGCLEEYGYDSEITECYGNYCNKKNLINVINGLKVNSEDVVFFYYGGHGSRALNNSNDPFPQMCLGEDYQDNWVPVTLIKNILVKKNPRLIVILTGCCNKEQRGVTIKSVIAESGSYTYESSIDKEAYKKLFLESTGIVIMTSSKAGQYSYSSMEGGIFCLNFWNAMEYVGQGKIAADWNRICEKVKQSVAWIPIQTEEGIVHQEPYYEITPKNTNVSLPTNSNHTPRHTVTINNNNSILNNDLKNLLNKSLNVEHRLQIIQDVLSKHFTYDAKVLTLGCDMNTIVDYEDAEVFLRRIVMSPYIRQINIVEQTSGKNKLIKVHEVRTK